jgi:hypothetical protein
MYTSHTFVPPQACPSPTSVTFSQTPSWQMRSLRQSVETGQTSPSFKIGAHRASEQRPLWQSAAREHAAPSESLPAHAPQPFVPSRRQYPEKHWSFKRQPLPLDRVPGAV